MTKQKTMTKKRGARKSRLSNAKREELRSEIARLCSAMRKTFGAGTGRPRVMRPCESCGGSFSAREMRQHKCPQKGTTNDQM